MELTDLHLYHGYVLLHLIITCVHKIHFVKLSFRTLYVNKTLNALFLSCPVQILYEGYQLLEFTGLSSVSISTIVLLLQTI